MKRKIRKSEIALFGVLVLSILFTFSMDSKVKRARALNKRYKGKAKGPPPGEPVMSDASGEHVGRVSWGEVFRGWGPDPFNRPFAHGLDRKGIGAVRAEKAYEEEPLRLYGVVISPRGISALINGFIVDPGDTMRRYVVETIRKDRVILRSLYDNSKTALKVE